MNELNLLVFESSRQERDKIIGTLTVSLFKFKFSTLK